MILHCKTHRVTISLAKIPKLRGKVEIFDGYILYHLNHSNYEFFLVIFHRSINGQVPTFARLVKPFRIQLHLRFKVSGRLCHWAFVDKWQPCCGNGSS